jgi:hypothetical protein
MRGRLVCGVSWAMAVNAKLEKRRVNSARFIKVTVSHVNLCFDRLLAASDG